jgi:hypothetical protein
MFTSAMRVSADRSFVRCVVMNFVIVPQPTGLAGVPRERVDAAHGQVRPAPTPGDAAGVPITARPRPRPAAQPAAPAPAKTGLNRRWAPRSALDRPGFIGGKGLEAPIRCVVCNTSKHGALLDLVGLPDPLKGGDAVPECFTLVFQTNRVRSEVNCTVRWRNRRKIGVNFIGPIHNTIERRG